MQTKSSRKKRGNATSMHLLVPWSLRVQWWEWWGTDYKALETATAHPGRAKHTKHAKQIIRVPSTAHHQTREQEWLPGYSGHEVPLYWIGRACARLAPCRAARARAGARSQRHPKEPGPRRGQRHGIARTVAHAGAGPTAEPLACSCLRACGQRMSCQSSSGVCSRRLKAHRHRAIAIAAVVPGAASPSPSAHQPISPSQKKKRT